MVLNRTTGIPTGYRDVIQAFIITLWQRRSLKFIRIKNGSKGKEMMNQFIVVTSTLSMSIHQVLAALGGRFPS